MTPEQTRLIERVRILTAEQPAVREVSMFGGRSVLANEKMIVSAVSDGSLLVRVNADRHDELVTKPGAAPAVMGRPGRTMGPGWIRVCAEAIRDDQQLSSWIRVALDHNRTVTGKQP